MVTNFGARESEIVEQMIERLRELQGTDEQVPPARKVIAGAGLQGGGSLERDVTLTLQQSIRDAVAALSRVGGADNLVTAAKLSEALQGYVKPANVPRPVVEHDLTIMEAPVETITAPPITVNARSTLKRVNITCTTPGSQPIVVSINGTRHTAPAGKRSHHIKLNTVLPEMDLISVSVMPTDAAGILVSLRIEE